MSLHNAIHVSLAEAQSALNNLLNDSKTLAELEKAGRALAHAFNNNGRVFSCGNGGSMCDAIHFAEELSGRYRDSRPSLAATYISDVGHLTCIGNDYGYEYVFSRYIDAHARAGELQRASMTRKRTLYNNAEKNWKHSYRIMEKPMMPLQSQ